MSTKNARGSGLVKIISESIVGRMLNKSTEYSINTTPDGRNTVNIDGHQIGSVFDTDFFRSSLEYFPGWINGHRMEVAYRFEEIVQQVMKSLSPRTYSGLYPYSHIVRVVEEIDRFSKNSGIPLDFPTLIGVLGHEIIEDDSEIRHYQQQWESALFSQNHALRQSLDKKILEIGLKKREDVEQKLIYLIPNGKEREGIEKDIRDGTKLMFDLTIFPNQLPYAISMGFQYTKSDDDSLSDTSRRMVIKNADRIENMEEIGPLHPPKVMVTMERVFNENNPVGNWLREKYGTVKSNVGQMSASMMIATAFKSIFPLHYSNQTFNMYARKVYSGKYDPRTAELFRLAILSRRDMATATKRLIERAISEYESDKQIKSKKSEVDVDIESKLQGTFYDRVTLDGFVKDWLLYDAGGRRFLDSLDSTLEQRRKNYKAARHINVLIPRFLMSYVLDEDGKEGKIMLVERDSLDFHPNKHAYFTVGGVEELLRLVPDYWNLVANLKAPTHEGKNTRASALLF